MAHTAPTEAEFKTRFAPRFASMSPEVYALLLEEAQGQVDDSWLETDYKPALMYLIAHLSLSETGQAGSAPGAIVSESFGPMSTTYAQGPASGRSYSSTEFGRRFAYLRSRNFPGVAVVNGPP